jgi:hypothetical protein
MSRRFRGEGALSGALAVEASPKQMVVAPPGGARTRLEARSVMKLPTFCCVQARAMGVRGVEVLSHKCG